MINWLHRLTPLLLLDLLQKQYNTDQIGIEQKITDADKKAPDI